MRTILNILLGILAIVVVGLLGGLVHSIIINKPVVSTIVDDSKFAYNWVSSKLGVVKSKFSK